jgi:hypothetical protein
MLPSPPPAPHHLSTLQPHFIYLATYNLFYIIAAMPEMRPHIPLTVLPYCRMKKPVEDLIISRLTAVPFNPRFQVLERQLDRIFIWRVRW